MESLASFLNLSKKPKSLKPMVVFTYVVLYVNKNATKDVLAYTTNKFMCCKTSASVYHTCLLVCMNPLICLLVHNLIIDNIYDLIPLHRYYRVCRYLQHCRRPKSSVGLPSAEDTELLTSHIRSSEVYSSIASILQNPLYVVPSPCSSIPLARGLETDHVMHGGSMLEGCCHPPTEGSSWSALA